MPKLGSANGAVSVLPPATARRVIIDTDWYTDVDDVMAMRVANYYERLGYVDILACIVDTAATNGAPSLDAYWRTENRPMQIGQIPSAATDLSAGGPYQTGLMSLTHYGSAQTAYPDSTTVYRTMLANSPDGGSVDIVSIGYLNALQLLLQSAGDAIDSRNGLALVTAKVRRLYVIGGQYPTGTENNFSRSAGAIAASSYVVTNWPTSVPIYFNGWEVGNSIISGNNLATAVPSTDTLYTAMVAHGSGTGRNSWDPLGMQLACIGDVAAAGYTTVQGTNVVNSSTGTNTFTPGAGGPHFYTVKNKTDAAFQASLNAIYVPGREPIPAGAIPVTYRGRTIPQVTGTTT